MNLVIQHICTSISQDMETVASEAQVSPIPTQLEQENVIETYNVIAPHFSTTRAYLWECVKTCKDDLLPGSVVIEVGCGNGKNILSLNNKKGVVAVGCDIVPYFVQTTYSQGVDCSLATNLQLPYRSYQADLTLSIAVIHHFDSQMRRKQAVCELLRVTRIGGKVLILVWAKEQPTGSRRQFTQSDNLVPWYNQTRSKVKHRYYHVFRKDELQELLQTIPDFRENFVYLKSWYEVGNWVTYIKRISVSKIS